MRLVAKSIVSTSSLLLIILLASASGRAQSAETAESAGLLEEIVVTAQRREERLQDVPISVSAITADIARARGIDDTEALQAIVPGLTFTRGAAYGLPVIRGIGTNTVSQGNENSVAVYVDGVLQISPSSSLFGFNNIERVEVLKGPQGTLFGRNATGGVINVITRSPGMEPGFEVELGVANYDTFEGNVYATTGLGENLAADIAVQFRDQSDGWGRNLVDGKDVFRGEERSVRSKWEWTPGDRTEVTISGSYHTMEDDGLSLHPAPGELGADGATTFQGMYTVNLDNSLIGGRSYADREGWGVDAHIRHDLGWAEFVSITGYSEVEVERPTDSDWTPLTILHAFVDQYDDGLTQEFQLQSPSDSAIQWITGLYYLESTSEFEPPRGIQIMGAAAGGLDYLRVLSTQDSKSYAGFAQVTVPILPKTGLTVGARYTRDDRDIEGLITFSNGGATPVTDQSEDFSKFTWRLALDHRLTEDIMVYGSLSTGFKAGLFNTANVAGDPVKPEEIDAAEIGLKSTLFNGRLKLNGAAFRYDYEDIQAEVVRSDAGGVLQLINAATSRVNGIEAELEFVPTAQLSIQAGISYLDAEYDDFPDAVIYLPNPAGGRLEVGGDASGNDMIKAPEWQWNLGGQYDVPLNTGQLRFAVQYSYQSKFYWDFGNDFKEPSRDMMAASVAWVPSDRWEIRAWGKNLLDEEITRFGLPSVWGFQQSPGAPRTYGVTLNMKM